MPDFELPSGVKGWLVAIIASLVGLISGGVTIKVARTVLG